MQVFFIPTFFTVMAFLICLGMSNNNGSTLSRSGMNSDNALLAILAIAFVTPTWVIYFSPHWYTAVSMTITLMLLSFAKPRIQGANYKMARFLWLTSLAVACLVTWITLLSLFIESKCAAMLLT